MGIQIVCEYTWNPYDPAVLIRVCLFFFGRFGDTISMDHLGSCKGW